MNTPTPVPVHALTAEHFRAYPVWLEDMARRAGWRLRIDDLWTDAPQQYRGSFQFSTAAARYCEQMLSLHQLPTQQAREDHAFAQLQECVAEEKALTDEQAAQELSPAISLCHDAIVAAALPCFRQANVWQEAQALTSQSLT